MADDRDDDIDLERAERMMARAVLAFLAIALAFLQIGLLVQMAERMAGQ